MRSLRSSLARRAVVAVAAAASVQGLCVVPVGAQAFTWINAAGGSFNTSTNWNPVGVPGSANRAVFNLASVAGYTVRFGSGGPTTTNQLDFLTDRVTFDLNGTSYTVVSSAVLGGASGNPTLTITDGTLFLPPGSAFNSGTTTLLTVEPTAGLSTGAGTFTLGSLAGRLGVMQLDGIGTFGWLRVGDAGAGTLSATGSFSSTTARLGDVAGSRGAVHLVDAEWSNGSSMIVGSAGEATLSVSGASSLTTATVLAGQGAGSTGRLTLSGASASINVAVTTRVGGSGTGTLEIQAGTLTTGSLQLAEGVGGSGLATVSGLGSRLIVSGQTVVGMNGSGTLTVNNKASVSTGATTIGERGFGYGSVSGSGVTWSGTGLTVGRSADGVFDVSAGGVGSFSAGLFVGAPFVAGDYSSGLIRLADGGSRLSIGGVAQVGVGGQGVVSVAGGASFSSNGLIIGNAATGSGLVQLSGLGSRAVSTGTVSVGPAGAGSLTLLPGTVFDAANQFLNIGTFGVVSIDNATLIAGSLARSGLLNFNSGTLALNSLTTPLDIAPGGPLGESVVLPAGKALLPTRSSVGTGGVLTLRGGRFGGGTVQNAGLLLIDDPSSVFTATLVENAGLIRGDGLMTADVTNAAGGEIAAASGGRLRIGGAVNNSGGLVSLQGGELEVSATFSNAAAGRITGRGLLRTGLLVNDGTVALSAGVSDVFGGVTQNAGGKAIVTGNAVATFYDDVTNNAGSEFRVSLGSTAVFFGAVSGLSQFTGPGTKTFEGPASLGRISTAGGSTRVGPFGSVVAGHIREAALSIEGTFALVPDPTATGTSRLNALEIAGAPGAWDGTLDLAANAMVIDYTGATPRATLAEQLRSGRAGGLWNGTGINSSVAAGTPNRAIGVAEAADIGVPVLFVGQPADSTSLLLRLTLPGDANLDGTVNIGDFSLLAANFNFPSYWAKGDFNYDGTTGIGDFALQAANFNAFLPADLPRGAAVPEPLSLAPGLALLAAVRRRRAKG